MPWRPVQPGGTTVVGQRALSVQGGVQSAVDRPRAGGLDGGVRRASVSDSALVGTGYAFLGAGPAGDDTDHPDIRLSRCLANARGMGGGAALSDGSRAGLVFN
eukprot:TRINITY_DN2535_c0_g3_i1.p3 TRINITY_DN2535_c0_g3~~TRINITY_DN2535_c0_g3_i1.p3  ORF type:complete len:103 (-),score=11.87 TRINITY_DN2535_c0_g3_i1:820-1128(-)